MIQYKTIYDISVCLGKESIDYPGDTPFSIKQIASIKKTAGFNLSKIVMSAHSGTHLDAPSHFIERKENIDSFGPDYFIIPAQVIEIKDAVKITPDELKSKVIRPKEAVLFKTKNSTQKICNNAIFSENYIYLSPEAADYCVSTNIALVGIDYITIEKYDDSSFASHHKLLSRQIFILEGINLFHVPPGHYTLICLPLKIGKAEASPARAILLK